MQKLKIGMIGTGNIAVKSYIPYLSQRGDVDLFYYDRVYDRAWECEKKFGGKAVKSHEELMSFNPDTILVLTHETQHLAAASSLIKLHPQRIFFEKPLLAKNGQAEVCEQDFFDGRELCHSLNKNHIEGAMNFNYRFFDITGKLQELIASKQLGKLRQTTLFVNYACWSHCIDLLRLFGGNARIVTALESRALYGICGSNQKSPDIVAAFELENGASGTILGTNGSSFFTALYSIVMNFENGLVKFSDLDACLSIHINDSRYIENCMLSPLFSRGNQYGDSFGKSLDAYINSIRKGLPPPVPVENGLMELQFEAALRRSAVQKRPVNVQTEFVM